MALPSADDQHLIEMTLAPLADLLDAHAEDIVQNAERAWNSSLLLFTQLTDDQRVHIRRLATESLRIWALRLRQDQSYARRVHELGQRWGSEAAEWELHIYSFTKALDMLGHAAWEYLSDHTLIPRLSPATVFFLGRSRDQLLEDIRVPLMASYLSAREHEIAETHFSLQGPLSLPGRSLLQELGNRLRSTENRVVPAWIESVSRSAQPTTAMVELLRRRGGALMSLLLEVLQSPTPETSAASLTNVRNIGMESANAGVSFQEMFHALQQLRPILWSTVYEIYRREQYWHPAEFIEALARLHLLLDLYSEGIGQAYLRQKEMIIQDQAEELRRRDLSLAREILEGLLPRRRMELPHTDIGAIWIPSREIGGDFFDIYTLPDGDAMFIIGDVSGKGISASLLVSMVKYVLKANAPRHHSPADLLATANQVLYQDMATEMFVTLFIARYTPATGAFVYTSAGHDPCYICRPRQRPHLLALPSRGPILGVFSEIELTDCALELQNGEMVFLYTDGLVNLRCGDHRAASARKLANLLIHQADRPTQELAQAVVDAATERCTATDDITIVILKREEMPYGG